MHTTVIIFVLYLKHVYCEFEREFENVIPVNDRLNDNVKNADGIDGRDHETPVRESRFLTFNNDRSNIRVEAVFAIPILAIPIGGKEASSSHGGVSFPTVDINLKSVISMAGILVVLFFVIPKLVQNYLPSKLTPSASHQSHADETIEPVMKRVYEALDMHNVDFESCAQKAVCWTFNNAASKVKLGRASGLDKLLDAVSSMPYLKYLLEDTWLWSILENGINFKNNEQATCQKFNKKCSITKNGLNIAAGSLLASIRNKNS